MKSLLLLTLSALTQDPMTGHTRDVVSLAISPNGKVLASGSVDTTIRLWDPATRQSVATLEGHGGEVSALAFSPDSTMLASGEMYKKVKIWDVAAKKEVQMFSDIDGAITGLVFSTDGKRLFAGTKDNSVLVWTIGADAPAKKLPHNWALQDLAMSPNGKVLATIDDGGTIHLWDTATLKETKSMKHADTARTIAFSADGNFIASGGGEMVKLWDSAGNEKASAKYDANSVAFSPDGSKLVVGTQDNLVLILGGTDLALKSKSDKHERPVLAVVVTPDGKTAFSGSMDMTLRRWAL